MSTNNTLCCDRCGRHIGTGKGYVEINGWYICGVCQWEESPERKVHPFPEYQLAPGAFSGTNRGKEYHYPRNGLNAKETINRKVIDDNYWNMLSSPSTNDPQAGHTTTRSLDD